MGTGTYAAQGRVVICRRGAGVGAEDMPDASDEVPAEKYTDIGSEEADVEALVARIAVLRRQIELRQDTIDFLEDVYATRMRKRAYRQEVACWQKA